jgi:hypothetical protein
MFVWVGGENTQTCLHTEEPPGKQDVLGERSLTRTRAKACLWPKAHLVCSLIHKRGEGLEEVFLYFRGVVFLQRQLAEGPSIIRLRGHLMVGMYFLHYGSW